MNFLYFCAILFYNLCHYIVVPQLPSTLTAIQADHNQRLSGIKCLILNHIYFVIILIHFFFKKKGTMPELPPTLLEIKVGDTNMGGLCKHFY
jgi:hypothetical protein